MATATSLAQAAGESFQNLFPIWRDGGNGLRTKLGLFASSLLPLFPDGDTVGRPIANWLTLIAGVAQAMPLVIAPAQVPYSLLVTAADYVYRICWLGDKPSPQSPQITNVQQLAILTAYNLNF